MKPVNTPVAIRLEFVAFDELLAPCLIRHRRTYSAIIEGLLLAEQAGHVRRAG